MHKTIILFSLLVTLAGCASSSPYVIADPVESTATMLKTVDNRSAKDVEGGLPLLFDPTYSVPDSRFSPPLIDSLKAELGKAFGASLDGKVLTLDYFSVDNDFGRSYQRNQATSMAVTSTTTKVIMLGDTTSGKADTVIVRIKGDLDGKTFSTIVMAPYSATPPMTYMGMVYDLPESREATRLAVSAAIKQVIDSLR